MPQQGSSHTTPSDVPQSDLAEQHDEVHDDTLSEIIMSVDMTPRGTVGCCYYVAREEKLYFMEDIQFSDVDIVDTRKLRPKHCKISPNYQLLVKTFIDPTVIIISTKVDDAVVERFDPEARGAESISDNNDQFRLPFLLDIRPASEFYYDAARSKIMALSLYGEGGPQVSFHVPGDHLGVHEGDGVHGQQGQLLRLEGWVDMESRVTVSGARTCASKG